MSGAERHVVTGTTPPKHEGGEREYFTTVVVLASDYDRLEQQLKRLKADRSACWAEFKVMTRSCLDAEKERDALRAQVEVMRADAERFIFVFTCPSPMIQIELEALRGEPKTIDWYRQKIDAALQVEP